MGVSTAWPIKLRQNQDPSPPSKLGNKGTGSKELGHESVIGPGPTTRNLTNRPSFTTVTQMQRALVCPMQAPYLLVQSHELPLAQVCRYVGSP